MAATAAQLQAIAQFNQVYGALLRDLQRATLQSASTNASARVLLALGRRRRASSRQLSDDLSMDPAQLSRVVWGLTDQGHIVSLPSSGDRRVGALVLTPGGETAAAALEAEQAASFAQLIDHLSPAETEHLVTAMLTVQHLLDRS